VDISTPGWSAGLQNIVKLENSIKDHVSKGVTAIVFDLFGNTSVRFEQDGTASSPSKVRVPSI
jgi:hypothetical protein